MRDVVAQGVWKELRKARVSRAPASHAVDGQDLDISLPCIVLAGQNGSGKSRTLREISDALGETALEINLHRICNVVAGILTTRTDWPTMTEEFDSSGPETAQLDTLSGVLRREYQSVEWYGFDFLPEAHIDLDMRWGGEEPQLPYFTASFAGTTYDSGSMGLGELSVHLLFWIIEQYRDRTDLTLILDEPDCFLPPVGVSALLAALLVVCEERGWNVILSTHSEEMIQQALQNDGLYVVRVGGAGDRQVMLSAGDRRVADHLLARPVIDRLIFCEDEVAKCLTAALLEAIDRREAMRTAIIWGDGHGYLTAMRKCVPARKVPGLRMMFLYDGDQRATTDGNLDWQRSFLPRTTDPDSLLRELRHSPDELAEALGTPVTSLNLTLDAHQGADAHDWVNGVALAHGRQVTLERMCRLWVSKNQADVNAFRGEVNKAFGGAKV